MREFKKETKEICGLTIKTLWEFNDPEVFKLQTASLCFSDFLQPMNTDLKKRELFSLAVKSPV